MFRRLVAIGLILLLVALDASAAKKPKKPKEKKDQKTPTQDVLATLRGQVTCKKWVQAIDDANLADTFQGKRAMVTLFAPSDEAFDKLKKEEVEALFQDKEKLLMLVTYHTIQGSKLTADDMLRRGKIQNATGSFTIKKDADGNFAVEQAVILNPNIQATNGVIHIIDMVLMPPK